MRPILQILYKDPFWTGLGLLAVSQLLWFWVAPQGFKSTWSQNPVVAHIVKEHDLVDQKAKLVAISYYYPTFQYFTDIVTGQAAPKGELMEGYHFGKPYIFAQYYHKAAMLLPERDEPHYLFGFSEFYLGDQDLATSQFEKSIDANPYFFWAYYNLGVIYFKQRDFLSSAKILSTALNLRKDISLEILRQSPFYRQIWRSIDNPLQVLEGNLVQGEDDAALIMAVCFIKAGGFNQALEIMQSIGKTNQWHLKLWEQLHQIAESRQRSTGDIEHLIQEQVQVRLF